MLPLPFDWNTYKEELRGALETDPSFYPSPKMAMEALPEKLAHASPW